MKIQEYIQECKRAKYNFIKYNLNISGINTR